MIETREILERAARYYGVLAVLSTKDSDCPSLQSELNKNYQSIKNYIIRLREAKLVTVKKHKKSGKNDPLYTISISELGRFSLKSVQDFKNQIETPSVEDEMTIELKRIVPLIEGDYGEKTITYNGNILYRLIADTKYQAIFSPLLRDFFERYISSLSNNRRIGDCLSISIGTIMSHLELKKWFYNKLYPRIVEQIENKEIALDIRRDRVKLLWMIFNHDSNKKSEIMQIFLRRLEQESSPSTQLSMAIYTNNMTETDVIIQELIKMKVNKETIDKFIH
jgi:hypothetical protein